MPEAMLRLTIIPADNHKPVCLIDEDARDYAEADNHADNHKPVEQWKKTQTASAARSMASMGSTDIASMSVKQIIQEIGELGGNAEGCYERQELEARLFNVRVAKKADGGDDARETRKERCSKKIVYSVGEKLVEKVVNLEPVLQSMNKEELREEVGACLSSGTMILVGDSYVVLSCSASCSPTLLLVPLVLTHL